MKNYDAVMLGDILTDDQISELLGVVSAMRGDPTEPKNIMLLKQLFHLHEKSLLEKGVLPDYLAYVVAYKIAQGKLV